MNEARHTDAIERKRKEHETVLTIATDDIPKLLEVLYFQATRGKASLEDVDAFLKEIRRLDIREISSIDGVRLGVAVPIKGNMHAAEKTTLNMLHLSAAGVDLQTIDEALVSRGVTTFWGSNRAAAR